LDFLYFSLMKDLNNYTGGLSLGNLNSSIEVKTNSNNLYASLTFIYLNFLEIDRKNGSMTKLSII